MVLEVVGAERDPGHLDGVAGPLRRGHRAHERLVAVADVRIDHVEVALVDRHVDRLADRPAAVVEVRAHVGELHEVAEVLDRAVAPAVVEVADERRAVVRGEDGVHPADLDVVRLVPGVLGELARRGRLDDLAGQPAREADPLALDVGAGVAEQAQRVRRRRGTRGRPPRGSCRRCARWSRGPPRRGPRTGASVRVRNGSRSTWAWRRAARRASRPPDRRRGCRRRSSVLLRGARSTRSVVARAGVIGSPAAAARRRRRRSRQVDHGRQVRGRRRSGGGTPSRRRSAPGTAARPRSRSSRRAATTSSISRRAAAADSSAIRAPVPAALPAALTRSSVASGISPRTIAWNGSIWLPNAPASRTSSTVSIPAWSISSRTPAYSAALASWIARTSFWVTAIRGRPVGGAVVEDVAERPAVRRRSRGVRAASEPSTIPSGVMTPARNSSAITSTMPEPQMPVIAGRRRSASANPARRTTARSR